MAKRASKKVLTGITEEEYQESLSLYAQAEGEAEKLVAKLNVEVTKLREKYDTRLNELIDVKEKHFEIVQTYCTENKKVLFVEKRSIESLHGRLGFRYGTPKLKTLPKMTWEKVLVKMKGILPDYVRKKEEVDKESLLADREKENVAAHLAEVGVYVDKDETFYIELKKETVEMPE